MRCSWEYKNLCWQIFIYKIVTLSNKNSDGIPQGYRHYPGHIPCNHTIFRHANFIGCLSADKIKMPVRKYFCFNIPVYRNMAEEPSCRSPYHEEYIQTSVSGNPEGLCHLTYNSLSKRR